jgi:hypothetical protein
MFNRNAQLTPLAAQADTIATRTSADIPNPYAHGLNIVVYLANKAGTVTFTPTVQGLTLTGTYYNLWVAAAALSANGTYIYQLTPIAVSNSSGITESKIALIPAVFRIVLTYSGAGAGNSFETRVDLDTLL